MGVQPKILKELNWKYLLKSGLANALAEQPPDLSKKRLPVPTAGQAGHPQLINHGLSEQVTEPRHNRLISSPWYKASPKQFKARRRLSHKNALSQQINKTADLKELAEVFVRFPLRILPITGADLVIKEPALSHEETHISWGKGRQNAPDFLSNRSLYTCQTYSARRAGSNLSLSDCELILATNEATQYCLYLTYAGALVALLYFYLPPNTFLRPDQRAIFTDLAPEMALALDNARNKCLLSILKKEIETENGRVIRNLHDTIAQDLAFLRIKLEHMASSPIRLDADAQQNDLNKLLEAANNAYSEVRRTLREIKSKSFAELSNMIKEYIQSIEKQVNFLIHFNIEGHPRPVPIFTADQVMVIISEILANIDEHAGAHTAEVRLVWGFDCLAISIADDGKGFDPQTLRANGHKGLDVIQERAKEIGGTLAVKSVQGVGTEVSMQFPTV